MFSKAKRFSYAEPEPKEESPSCQRFCRNQTNCSLRKPQTSTPSTSRARASSSSFSRRSFRLPSTSIIETPKSINVSTPSTSTDPNSKLEVKGMLLAKELQQLQNLILELRNTSRSSSDEGIASGSSRSSSPPIEEVAASIFGVSSEGSEISAEVYVEMIAELVVKKLAEKEREKEEKSVWKRTKFFVKAIPALTRGLFKNDGDEAEEEKNVIV